MIISRSRGRGTPSAFHWTVRFIAICMIRIRHDAAASFVHLLQDLTYTHGKSTIRLRPIIRLREQDG